MASVLRSPVDAIMSIPRADLLAARERLPSSKLRVLRSTIRDRFGKKNRDKVADAVSWKVVHVLALPGSQAIVQAMPAMVVPPASPVVQEVRAPDDEHSSEHPELRECKRLYEMFWDQEGTGDYSVVPAPEAAPPIDVGPSTPRTPAPAPAYLGHAPTGYTTVPGKKLPRTDISGNDRPGRTRPDRFNGPGSTTLVDDSPARSPLARPPVPIKDLPRNAGFDSTVTGTKPPRQAVPSTAVPDSPVAHKTGPGNTPPPPPLVHAVTDRSAPGNLPRAVSGNAQVPVHASPTNGDAGHSTFPGYTTAPRSASTVPPASIVPANTTSQNTVASNTTPGDTLSNNSAPSSGAPDDAGIGDSVPSHMAPRRAAPLDHAPPNRITLWDKAYQQLKDDEAKNQAVNTFERLLSKHMSSTSDDIKIYADRRLPANKISADPRARHDQLDGLFTQHHFEGPSTARAVFSAFGKVISFFDDWISDAVQISPQASLAWGVVRVFLPLLTNPRTQNEARLKAVTYVTMRSSYYAQLELVIEGIEDKAARETMQHQLVSLYKHMIDVQVRGVVHAYNQFKSFKDMLGIGDWKESLERVKTLEVTVNNDFKVIPSLAETKALTAIQANISAAIGKIEGLSEVAHAQLCEMQRTSAIVSEGVSVQKQQLSHILNQEDMACLRALAPETTSGQKLYVDLKDSLPDAVSGTCQWFLRQQQVKEWLHGQSHGILFLTAGPGCGKSVLAKYMIDCVLPQEDPSSTVCYFFFKERVQDSLAPAIASLLHQLLSQNEMLIRHAKEHVQKHKDITNSPSILWEIFHNAINDPVAGRLVFVIDALDECAAEDIDRLVQKLRKLHPAADRENAVRFLLTGRRSRRLNKAHRDLSDHCVDISGDHFAPEIEQEVSLVTRTRIAEYCEGLPPNTQRSLETRLLGQGRHADRTYLWVHLVFEYLNNASYCQRTAKGIQKELQHLPTTVEDAYEKLLQQSLSSQSGSDVDAVTDLVRRTFCILLAARRPLTVTELREALAMEQDPENMEYPGALADLDLEEPDEDFAVRLNQQCGLMLSISSGTVTFFHQTIIDFLLPSKHIVRKPSVPVWGHSISLDEAQFFLAKICMDFLLLEEFRCEAASFPKHVQKCAETDTMSTWHAPVRSSLFQKHRFVEYASSFWDFHYRMSRQAGSSLQAQALQLCDIEGVGPRLWILRDCCQQHAARQQLNAERWHWFDESFSIVSQLWLYAFVGLDFAVTKELKKIQGDAPGDSGLLKTALLVAVMNGHTSTIEILHNHGADINMKFGSKWSFDRRGGQTETLLHLVAKNGDSRTLRCLDTLMRVGARISEGCFLGRTPLHQLQNTAVATLMLKNSTLEDLNRRDHKGRTALRWQLECLKRCAAPGGAMRQEIIAMMLRNGADVEGRIEDAKFRLKDSETALMQARDVSVAELLLSSDAEINATDSRGWTFLMHIVGDDEELSWWCPYEPLLKNRDQALRHGRSAMIDLLLSHGADVAIEDVKGNTAFSLARRSSDLDLLNRYRVPQPDN